MKQATQLEIPFDDIQSVEPSTVPGASSTRHLSFDDVELRALRAIRRAAAKADSFPVLVAQAAVLVGFGFTLMFIAAIIGG